MKSKLKKNKLSKLNVPLTVPLTESEISIYKKSAQLQKELLSLCRKIQGGYRNVETLDSIECAVLNVDYYNGKQETKFVPQSIEEQQTNLTTNQMDFQYKKFCFEPSKYDWENQYQNQNKKQKQNNWNPIVRIFGVTQKGESVSIRVHGF